MMEALRGFLLLDNTQVDTVFFLADTVSLCFVFWAYTSTHPVLGYKKQQHVT